MEEVKNEIMENQTQEVAGYDPNVAYGFEETKSEDILIPRVKVINALSPERIEGTANEGDILNSLTKEALNGKRFIPIKQYYSNIEWNPDRNADTRIFCRSSDGRIGFNGTNTLVCANCKRNQFDNTKTGKDSQPKCTAYLNFLGFFEGSPMPVILSFAKTNYNEGKKMLSIAKSLRASLWNYAYTLSSKKITKDRNTWYIITPMMAGDTDIATRTLAFELYKAYDIASLAVDYEDAAPKDNTQNIDTETESELI